MIDKGDGSRDQKDVSDLRDQKLIEHSDNVVIYDK